MKNEEIRNEEVVEEVKVPEVIEAETEIMTKEDSEKVTNMLSTNKQRFTNIKDKKLLFNLGDHVDHLLNDMDNKEIEVHGILINAYEKVNRETGELERSMATVIVDDSGTSYATGSKLFGMRMLELLDIFDEKDFENGVLIRITKSNFKGSNNKKLGFELV